mgnify:CR=1 FL=1
MKNCLFFSKHNLWSEDLFNKLKKTKSADWRWCSSKEDYDIFNSDENVDWAFFFHWNHIVPEFIYEKNRCVVLHTSNLPEFRGGSPIQNQIIAGVKESKVNALKMVKKIDGGPVYDSKSVSLQGSLTDIWLSISEKSFEIIMNCIENEIVPVSQLSFKKPVKRRKTCEIPVDKISSTAELYNFIRMLDAEGYEKSFVKIGPLKVILSRAKIIDSKKILTDAIIEWEEDESFSNSSTSRR